MTKEEWRLPAAVTWHLFVLSASEEAKEEENVWWMVRSPCQGAAGDLSGETGLCGQECVACCRFGRVQSATLKAAGEGLH